MRLPKPRGPLSALVVDAMRAEPPIGPYLCVADPDDEDLQLALTVSYEVHYRGFDGVSPAWEWEPSLLELRRELERRFVGRLTDDLGPLPAQPGIGGAEVEEALLALASEGPGPSISRYMEREATAGEFRELLVHRSVYHLKEADPHSWGIPRLVGRAKAALVEIQADEYGSGRADRMHSVLFARAMRALGLDDTYGAYLDAVPGVTLATVNLISLFGLHRRWRGALGGHLALFEMTSSTPNRRYGNGVRRLGFGPDATEFFDEHVVADSVHELIALRDLARPLADEGLGADVVFGARALALLDGRASDHMLRCWAQGISSLRPAAIPPLLV